MAATTLQHPAVASLAIVVTKGFGTPAVVTLRSKKQTATTSDWWMYQADHCREFATAAEAEAVAKKVCPIFTGSAGSFLSFQRFDVDAWNNWTAR